MFRVAGRHWTADEQCGAQRNRAGDYLRQQIRFDLTISDAAVEQPSNGKFGSTFAAQLLAADGVTPESTIDPSGAVAAENVKPDGSTTVTNFASSALGARRPRARQCRRRTLEGEYSARESTESRACRSPGVIATFTDAYPFGTAGDFTAVINWGDHLSSDGVVAASAAGFQVTGQHTYAQQGT